MRKLTFGGAVSLDHYLARADGGLDWLMFGPEAGEVMAATWANVDTVLMGRKTYEFAARSGAGGDGGMPGVGSYVFSRTLADVPGATVVRDDAAGFVRGLKARPGKDMVLMGGGELAASLFAAGLIDEIGFNVHPVLLGAGVPLFHRMPKQIDLELKECRPFANGCVLVTYRVKN